MRKTRIAVFGVASALLASLAIASIGSAHDAHHNHAINIRVDPDRPFMHGVIQSKAERCERERYLFVKRLRPGHNKFVGDDITSYRGGWSVDVNRAGRFAIRIKSDGHCGGDRQVVVSPGQ